MKKIKSALMYVLVFFVLFLILIPSAYAFKENDSEVIFPDVSRTSYYADAVLDMYNKGYVKGYPDGNYGPLNNLTKAEALTLLFRISGRKIENLDNTYWYSDVINVSKRMGIFQELEEPTDFANRLDLAKYIVGIYTLKIENTTVSNVFSDIETANTNLLYEKGIFEGVVSENELLFLPYDYITRGDMCLLMQRILSNLESPYNDYLMVGDIKINSNPTEKEDFYVIMNEVVTNNKFKFEIPYYINIANEDIYRPLYTNLHSVYTECFSKYPEWYSFTNRLSVLREMNGLGEGLITVSLKNTDLEIEYVKELRQEFFDMCVEIRNQLYEDEKLSDTMPDIERAKVLFEYVAKNCEYAKTITPESYTGWGAAVNKKAVCQGYTAMFNYLCQLDGIVAEGVTGRIKENNILHSWSRLKFEEDDDWHYCDATFSDPMPNKEDYCDLNYFDMTYEEMIKDRIMDETFV